MTLFIFILIPLAWAFTGWLLGCAVSASCFFSERGRRWGKLTTRTCLPLLPVLYLALVIIGGRGDAAHGVTIFGSELVAGIVLGIPFYAIPALAIYAGAIYVVRDLTLGHVKTTVDQNRLA